jgi:hypothetical protein
MRNVLALLLLSSAVLAPVSMAADNVAVSKMALVTIDGSIDIAAPPAKVWNTIAKSLADLKALAEKS